MRTSFLVCWVACACAVGMAQSIEPPVVYPDVVFVGNRTPVIVKAVVEPDSNLILSSVNVIQFDGRAQVGERLYDDGTHGDEFAGDMVFTASLSLVPKSIGQVRFFVSAAYRTGVIRVASEGYVVTVITPPTTEELGRSLRTQQNAGESFTSLRKRIGDERAREEVVSNLRKEANVRAAGISSDGYTIWIKYANGLEANILTGPVNTKHSKSSLPIFNPNLLGPSVPNGSGCSCNNTATPKVKPVVLAPFFDQFSPADESDVVAQALTNTCLEPSYAGKVRAIKNTAVNVEIMKSLYQFNVVYVSSHGNVNSEGNVQITTREQATTLSILRHFSDWWNGRITPVYIGDGKEYWAVTSKFVDHYSQRRFKNALVYLSACLTFGPDGKNFTLANAFRSNGVDTYFGWQESVTYWVRLFNW